jgi:hypothetical protein
MNQGRGRDKLGRWTRPKEGERGGRKREQMRAGERAVRPRSEGAWQGGETPSGKGWDEFDDGPVQGPGEEMGEGADTEGRMERSPGPEKARKKV